MKQSQIHTALLVIVALLCGYFVLFGRSSAREAKKISEKLEVQLDSLAQLSKKYEEIHASYVTLHNDLSQTRDRVSDLKVKLEEISKTNVSSVSALKKRLNEVIAAYDSVDYRINPSGSNDDLTFN